jgi:hypothetical protein
MSTKMVRRLANGLLMKPGIRKSKLRIWHARDFVMSTTFRTRMVFRFSSGVFIMLVKHSER